MKKIFTAFIALLASAAVFAQSAASDFETKANTDGTVTITKYVGWDTEVVIPAQIGGKAVTAIGAGAFENSGLTAVTIPEGVKRIENGDVYGGDGSYREGGAFARNKLTSVVIPGSLTFIGRGAFADNPLTSLTLGDGVEIIGKSAFRGNKLTKVVIPDSVTSIGGYAFVNAKPALKSVTLGKGLLSIGGVAFFGGLS